MTRHLATYAASSTNRPARAALCLRFATRLMLCRLARSNSSCDGTPRGKDGVGPFDFRRLGLRVPAMLISPWVREGSVIQAPRAGPFASSQFEHSSIPATIKGLFGLTDFLTKRDEVRLTIHHKHCL